MERPRACRSGRQTTAPVDARGHNRSGLCRRWSAQCIPTAQADGVAAHTSQTCQTTAWRAASGSQTIWPVTPETPPTGRRQCRGPCGAFSRWPPRRRPCNQGRAAARRGPRHPQRTRSWDGPGSEPPAASRPSVSVQAQLALRRSQSLRERAQRDASHHTTAPPRPRPPAAMRDAQPSRPAGEAPERPWSWAMLTMRGSAQPRSRARVARWSWRAVLAVLARTCRRVAWRTETRAGRVQGAWRRVAWGSGVRLSSLLGRPCGLGWDTVACQGGSHGDGLGPTVGCELTPALRRPRRRGQT
jgi:hypothetical protein